MKFSFENLATPSFEVLEQTSAFARDISDLDGYDSLMASAYLPRDKAFLQSANEAVARFSTFQHMVVIGIGGANLGTLAVLDALDMNGRIISLDTPDPVFSRKAIRELRELIDRNERIIVNIVSKSGSTMETLSLAHVLASELPASSNISYIVTTDHGSPLESIARSEGWETFPIPKLVGGRYSVLSLVGLLPLGFSWVDIHALLSGAKDCLDDFVWNPKTHPSAIVAAELSRSYLHGRNVFEHFFFAKRYESVGKWYRQLLAESIWKVIQETGNATDSSEGMSIGITPTTSIGTTDLHSVAQLNLAHSEDRVLAQVRIDDSTDIPLEGVSPFSKYFSEYPDPSFRKVMDAALIGNREAWLSKGGPYFEYDLDGSSQDLGYFLQAKMLEVMLLGRLFGINPFDQPNVEDYKIGMRRALVG